MGRDRISELPESLLTQIFSYLPTKDSVRTSVLSKRWEFLWLMVPGLDVDLRDFPDCSDAFEIFIDKFLASNRTLQMQKFKIIANEECDIYLSPQKVGEWICLAVDLGIQHLDVDAYIDFMMPQHIYRSNTLVSLKLDTVGMENPEFVVSLPCLKIMQLQYIWYDDDPLIIEKLISGCPVLEDLTLYRPADFWNEETILFLRVRSQTLKHFCHLFDNGRHGIDFSVEIEAPGLECLSFCDDESDTILVKNLSSLSMITIHGNFNVKHGSPLDPEDLRKRDIICDFLTGVSGVRRMIIGKSTLKTLYQYSDLGPIPKFDNLHHLEAMFSRNILQFLPVFLDSCPNLKNPIVRFCVSRKPDQEVELSYMPRCLSSTLEHVEIKGLIREEETGTKLVNYFLENSAALKKVSVSYKDSPMTEIDIYKKLHSGKISSM